MAHWGQSVDAMDQKKEFVARVEKENSSKKLKISGLVV
jgi:hypothetical protein